MKILVAIANYGTKNDEYLQIVLSEYKKMPFCIDIVVLSNIKKCFGPDIEVITGMPSRNPFSLPFGHKKLFAERIEDYDLFIYSEDDTLITETNINAFLKVTKILPDDQIAGFIRYEEYQNSERYYTTIHSHYHWIPTSVKTIGKYTFAHFSNDHSACFILTRDQLIKAVLSGGFLSEPRQGAYDMLCTAATDPYTRCGFQKLICISHLDQFSLHHLPNVYRGKMGIERSDLEVQIKAMKQIEKGVKSSKTLFRTKTNLNLPILNKKYYEPARFDIIDLIPECCEKVLSIGCGWGATEYELVKKGKSVTGIPIDSIIGASAKLKGIQILEPDFGKAMNQLKGKKFGCLLFINILQFLEDPDKIMNQFNRFIDKNGLFIVTLPNFSHIYIFRKIISRNPIFKDIIRFRSHYNGGFRYPSKKIIKKWFHSCKVNDVRAFFQPDHESDSSFLPLGGFFDFLFSSNLVTYGQKSKE